MPLKIAIVGAGPAGCMLARLLQQQPNVSVTVFESEPSIDYRSQGGSLDLHEQMGLLAIKRAGLHDAFLAHARYDGEALLVCDGQMKPYITLGQGTDAAHSRGRPEIDRADLRRILLESLPAATVRWSHRLQRVRDDGRTLEFVDGTTATGYDLVVGGDGAWSRVRALLCDTKPEYAGMGGFQLNIPNAAETAPECAARVNRGAIFAYSTGCMMSAQQLSDGSINMGLWRVRPEGWEKQVEYDLTDGRAVREAQQREFADYAPEMLHFVDRAVDSSRMMSRSFYAMPVGFRWAHRPGVTLIGDAAHVICPFTGEGVNQALMDALQLAEAIHAAAADSGDVAAALDSRVRRYEDTLYARAAVFQKRAADVAHTMYFTEGSPATTIEFYALQNLKNSMSPAKYKAMYPLLATGVYGYFFWQKHFHS
ncbi:hypothetical protein ASPZODRAFT_894527 [Penicilliopsis zonata CBS 506.65]|uniref:FAD-binding domain-containing protein n=1 Tax=Penicilliopsis zonata CBS 506.65 TaxID=1073090 RepID=A0A1L9S8N3_9EURO|nr:hypothetical protein ASPZODRAFT_894527 [Penicilliopsis zonata CBS 506.65]OJJ43518.1 hypothetical protein ASPZODRAFT_894527 [Penicilliopsis zonata CBS 506.65]